ncbi:hypothetical protein GCM10010347_08410 [Streptomyces cirratus]|uniref:Uncharacterized protein n=1 Tax=Streptomyces cirratus TaxID=68187 RepID=A0ABQ3ERE2_9ACTN|nr:hypothetical protein GCM10010347_08410 [Streptomyces cirratus]
MAPRRWNAGTTRATWTPRPSSAVRHDAVEPRLRGSAYGDRFRGAAAPSGRLEQALPSYEKLTGEAPARCASAGPEPASAGPFLLFAGPPQVAAPADTPNGRRAVLRHPDGAVYEYVGT